MAAEKDNKYQLGTTKGTFVNDKGEEVEYDVFTLTVMGFPVRVKPADGTAKEILKMALGVE